MNIGKSVKIALAQKEMSRHELANLLDVSQATVSILTNNATCSGPILEKLYKIFDMKASDLIALGE